MSGRSATFPSTTYTSIVPIAQADANDELAIYPLTKAFACPNSPVPRMSSLACPGSDRFESHMPARYAGGRNGTLPAMRWLIDSLYLFAAVVTAPLWLVRMFKSGKLRTDWRARFGKAPRLPSKTRPRVLFHAVSVGEVNAIRQLVDDLAHGPDALEIVIAATTDTGFARAKALWQHKHAVVRYPFDFSFAVNRFLNAVNPDIVALVELEVWPNFTAACRRRGIPVGVVNGRLTERSFRRYQRIASLIRPSFQRLTFVAAQDETYARRFEALGAAAEAIHITGTMKWDTAQITDTVTGAEELAALMGIDRNKPLIVAGSTAPGEHELLVSAKPAGVQLLCAPRKPEWFEQAEQAMPGCVRRSQRQANATSDNTLTDEAQRNAAATELFLLDSIGELRQAYALADIVVIGRSFGNLHGSDMMEPIALGKPTIVGPAVTDFQQTMDALIAGGGVIQTTADQLPAVLRDLLHDPQRRAELACRGRAVIRAHQGASSHTAQLIRGFLGQRQSETSTARELTRSEA